MRELLSLSDHSMVLIRMGFVRLLLELLTPPSMRPDTAGSAGSGGRNAKAKAKARPKGGKARDSELLQLHTFYLSNSDGLSTPA